MASEIDDSDADCCDEFYPCTCGDSPCAPGVQIPDVLQVEVTNAGDNDCCNGTFLIYRNPANTFAGRHIWTTLLNIGGNQQEGTLWTCPADADGNGSYFVFQCELGGDRATGGYGWTMDNDDEGIIYADSFDPDNLVWVFTLSISLFDTCDVPATLTITVPSPSWQNDSGLLSGTFGG